jgi:uncharacterized RDD family membrane protein YckC
MKILATWWQRFWAWLIDFIVIGVFTAALIPAGFWYASLIFFLYWTILEGYKGQSLGKMALGIKVVHRSGRPMNVLQSAVQSFGKSVLLPLDVLIGLLIFQKEKQRVFNRLSDTVVVSLSKPGDGPFLSKQEKKKKK